ncbi:redoxin domain-containing protein [Sphingomonas ginkgonis]|uniref:Redoxin domain-containing protein n=2 Tax=Sphingomonas ginkgonis TaxID=2315330 RepID=A0A3R9WUP7_9SPHN|nr:redoxin domain-containing protein [Sphingomonas ginkgonis]
MVGKPVPDFTLAAGVPSKPGFASAELRGKPRVINFFASWCVPCIAEAPMLARLRAQGVEIDGVAIRDRPEDIARFLRDNGDPYARIGADPRSAVQLAMGSSGVPESFVVDGRGLITYQWPGPITDDNIATIVAELERAR